VQFVRNTRAFSILGATLRHGNTNSTDSEYVEGRRENHFSDHTLGVSSGKVCKCAAAAVTLMIFSVMIVSCCDTRDTRNDILCKTS
jgi:hypothetical protein